MNLSINRISFAGKCASKNNANSKKGACNCGDAKQITGKVVRTAIQDAKNVLNTRSIDPRAKTASMLTLEALDNSLAKQMAN